MLRELTIDGVGPIKDARLSFAARMNLLTGDNGLGKSFLLETAWWALTRTWTGAPAWPGAATEARIGYTYDGRAGSVARDVPWRDGGWQVGPGRPPIPGMVIYAGADGGFGVWDPARNYSRKGDAERPAAFVFDRDAVWTGLHDDGRSLCNGLIEDWVFWQLEGGEAFRQLESVLAALSEGPPVPPLRPGPPGRLPQPDTTRYPTLRMPYGKDVPIVHASAGMRRIVALAYLLVWAWQEHQEACRQSGEAPVGRIIFLIDELESHLHPRWQREILPALLKVMEALTGDRAVDVQIIAATHSPMVMTSIEPHFDAARDRVWTLDLDLDDGRVRLTPFDWSPGGDANAWLVSDLFDLSQPRSRPAEDAIAAIADLMRDPNPSEAAIRAADVELRAAGLRQTDPLGARWHWFMRQRGLTP